MLLSNKTRRVVGQIIIIYVLLYVKNAVGPATAAPRIIITNAATLQHRFIINI